MSEVEESGTLLPGEPVLQPGQEDLSADELRDVIDNMELGEAAEQPEATEESAEEETEEIAASAEDEAEEQPEAEAAAETEEGAEKAETETAEEDPALELAKLEREQTEERIADLERRLGRQAGEDGFWKRKAQELEAQLQQPAARTATEVTDDYREPDPAPAPVAQRQPDPAQSGDAALLQQIALEKVAAAFAQDNPEAIVETDGVSNWDPDLQAEMAKRAARVKDILDAGGGAADAAVETQKLFEESWSQVRRGRRNERIAELRRRSVDSAAKVKARKRGLAVSSSGGTSAAPQKKPVDQETMPLDELAALIDGG